MDLGDSGWARFDAGRFGPLWIAWVPEGLTVISLDGAAPARGELARWMTSPEALEERSLPRIVRETLTAYFAGEAVDPAALPVRLRGTKFQRRAWTALRDVGRGQVRTYAGLAQDVNSPRSMRAIGMAMAKNPLPLVVPCHRVVAAGNALGGYSGGLDKKRFLLELEGVTIQDDRVLPGQLALL